MAESACKNVCFDLNGYQTLARLSVVSLADFQLLLMDGSVRSSSPTHAHLLHSGPAYPSIEMLLEDVDP